MQNLGKDQTLPAFAAVAALYSAWREFHPKPKGLVMAKAYLSAIFFFDLYVSSLWFKSTKPLR